MALETTPVQPVSPASSSSGSPRHAGRRADGANANSAFAQLLRGQREGAQAALGASDPAADAARSPRPEAKDDEAQAASDEAQDDDSPEAKAGRKLPNKQQLGAEDLGPQALGLKGSQGNSTEALGRLLSAGRAQARQAALNAERGRETRLAGGRGEDDASAAQAAGNTASFAGLLAASELRSADAAASGVAATSALQTPAQSTAAVSVEGVLPSLATPGEAVPTAPAPLPEPLPAVPDAYATLAQTPGSEAFPAALGAQLRTWLDEGGVEYAQLELNPRELGPIDVRIALRDGDTRVELASAVPATREALEQALPQLAEALGDVGLAMSGGQVSDQSTGDRSGQSDPQAQARQAASWLRGGSDAGAEPAAPMSRPPVNPRALLDLYA